jgi:hypothetical protein
MAVKRKRRTKAEIEAEKTTNDMPDMVGLGDVIESITEVTGIKALVHFIAGEDCGCEERKQKLNKISLFKRRSPKCFEEHEFTFIDEFLKSEPKQIKPSTQKELLTIYNRVFSEKQEPTQCVSCWKDIVNKLKELHSTYAQ